jgi:hypothetical protein
MAIVASAWEFAALGSPEPPQYTPSFDALGFPYGAVGGSTPPPGDALPDYARLPSLEPWLGALRGDAHLRPGWSPHHGSTRASLARFTAGGHDGWADTHAALCADRRRWGLAPDPHEGVRALFWPETAATRARLRKDADWLPAELRNTALWMLLDKETITHARTVTIDVSPVLIGRCYVSASIVPADIPTRRAQSTRARIPPRAAIRAAVPAAPDGHARAHAAVPRQGGRRGAPVLRTPAGGL